MMSSALKTVALYYNQTFEYADTRVSDWPMMQSPWPTLVICLSYVYFVKYLGPSIMKDRKPLDIRWLMATYNFSMVILSFLIFYWFGIYGWFGKYSWTCQPVDYSYTPDAIGMAKVCWWFYVSKFIEFSDTIFFVMRKKHNQVSTLHVTHHGIMPMSVWWGLKFTPGGHSTFFAFVNSFVHVLMYVYYGLAALHMSRFLWWKKHMTSIQMVQFIMIFTHSFQLLFTNCNYPQGFMWWIGFHAILFWFLFADFYRNAYRKKFGRSAKLDGSNVSLTKNGLCVEDHSDKYVNGNGYSGLHGHLNGNEHANGYETPKNGYINCNLISENSDSSYTISKKVS